MSYQLVNQAMEISRTFSRQSWAKALELARLYGWQPRGTCTPRVYASYRLEAEWNGTYLTNDGQIVLAEDAYFLAAALERALDDISDERPEMDWNVQSWREDDLPEWLAPWERALIEESLQDGLLDTIGTPPFEFFAGEEKSSLVHFIRFCRLGSFEIQ
jgi:hypothetical protein